MGNLFQKRQQEKNEFREKRLDTFTSHMDSKVTLPSIPITKHELFQFNYEMVPLEIANCDTTAVAELMLAERIPMPFVAERVLVPMVGETSGVLAFAAATKGASNVIVCDENQTKVDRMRHNIAHNLEVLQAIGSSKPLDTVKKSKTCIALTSLSVLSKTFDTILPHAYYGTLDYVIANIPRFHPSLQQWFAKINTFVRRPGGVLLFTQSSVNSIMDTCNALKALRYDVKILSTRDLELSHAEIDL